MSLALARGRFAILTHRIVGISIILMDVVLDIRRFPRDWERLPSQ
jgi:hypothetical protein